MYKKLFTGFLSCYSIFVYAQTHIPVNGAASEALASTRSIDILFSSPNNNPAFLIQKEKSNRLSSNFTHQYHLNELNTTSFTYAHFHKKNGYSLSLDRFGATSFNTQNIHLGFAHGIGNFSMGFNTSAQQISFAETSKKILFTINAGCQYLINNKIQAGFLITNISRNTVDEYQTLLPSYALGFRYTASEQIHFLVEFKKLPQSKTETAVAMEYLFQNYMYFRLGIIPDNLLWTAGLGFIVSKKINADFAYQLHEILGNRYTLSIFYQL